MLRSIGARRVQWWTLNLDSFVFRFSPLFSSHLENPRLGVYDPRFPLLVLPELHYDGLSLNTRPTVTPWTILFSLLTLQL